MARRKIAVIGLGYVGLPVAAAFAAKQPVIAFDINTERIQELKKGKDHTKEIPEAALKQKNFFFTHHPEDLKHADFFIIAVPTPINKANQPNLQHILAASKLIAPYLKKKDIVVYESTVYPGTTEEECAPILEHYSGLKCGHDFFVGYSPERINPGDKEHCFTKVTKIVSGQNEKVLNIIAEMYEKVVTAGVYKTNSIKVAEAAKVIENTQRDLNIAFVNELAKICHRLNIDTNEVLSAASTKWNFIPFKPGLVGGHCIGVDPYYLTHKATSLGLHPQVILAGRCVNDDMGVYIAKQTAKLLAQQGTDFSKARIGILGLTFKENCPDIRNSKVIDIIRELKEYSAEIIIHDPLADPAKTFQEYQIQLSTFEELKNLDAIILAVAHKEFHKLQAKLLKKKLKKTAKIIIDVKAMLNQTECKNENLLLWRL